MYCLCDSFVLSKKMWVLHVITRPNPAANTSCGVGPELAGIGLLWSPGGQKFFCPEKNKQNILKFFTTKLRKVGQITVGHYYSIHLFRRCLFSKRLFLWFVPTCEFSLPPKKMWVSCMTEQRGKNI